MNFDETLWPLFRSKAAADYRTAIFSEQQRKQLGGTVADEQLTPGALLADFPSRFASDVGLLKRDDYAHSATNYGREGSASDLFIHFGAEISPQACLDARGGAIVIEQGASVSAFSLVKGPAFIGAGTFLHKASLANSSVGHTCRLGGEIADSIIGDFTNKAHEGFVGHSLVGDWVNLGALTTTSDLKNNYGEVRLQFEDKEFSTGTIKFGSIIGDFAKTAIGTMLNSGTIIDAGAMLFEGRPAQKYYPPFFWGGAADVYQWARFAADLTRIMARREQKPGAELLESLEKLHSQRYQA